jgi:hypothetical protein
MAASNWNETGESYTKIVNDLQNSAGKVSEGVSEGMETGVFGEQIALRDLDCGGLRRSYHILGSENHTFPWILLCAVKLPTPGLPYES